MKNILKRRDNIEGIQSLWDQLQNKDKFVMKDVYNRLRTAEPKVHWHHIFLCNMARPKALIMLWMACHGRLATKHRWLKFGLVNDGCYCFISEEETVDHLFYGCTELKTIWSKVLVWLQINREPHDWKEKLNLLIPCTKGKGWRITILKLTAA